MTPLVVNALTFLAVFLAIFAANALLMDLHSNERRRIKKRMKAQQRTQQQKRAKSAAALSKDFSQIAAEARNENSGKSKFAEAMQFMVEQSGLDLTVARLMTIAIVCSLLAGVVCGGLSIPPESLDVEHLARAVFPEQMERDFGARA